MSNAASTPEFKKILQNLYDSGKFQYSGDVLKEAWKIYRERHGQTGTVQQRRYAMRKTAMGMNPHKNQQVYHPKFGSGKIIKGPEGDRFLVKFKSGKRIWITEHNLQTDLSKENPSRFRHERIRSPKGLHHLRTLKTNGHRIIIGCPVPSHRGRCPVPTVLQAILHSKRERNGTGKNPIAVYGSINSPQANPRVSKKLPATDIEIRYRRMNGAHRGKYFKHAFKSSISLYGLPSGDILLKSNSGKKLWGSVD